MVRSTRSNNFSGEFRQNSGGKLNNKLKAVPFKAVEKQGPTDWSINGLKSKYRGESEREEAWRAWLNSVSLSDNAAASSELIIPVSKMERHPFFTFFYRKLYDENLLSANRTRSRLLMKRFVFDVQEVWLTNLQHLNEHNPERLFRADKDGTDDDGANYSRGTGIKNRRDVRAIANMESQISSVSQRRVFDKAYHTARMPPIGVMLDYQPAPTPALRCVSLLPPSIETLLSDIAISLAESDEYPILAMTSEAESLRPHTERDFLLHVDRLLPSPDYLVSVQSEVLWRLALYRCSDLRAQYFIAREADVAAYIARIILQKSQSVPQTLNHTGGGATGVVPPRVLVLSRVVYSSPPGDVVTLPWHSCPSVESRCRLSISVLGYAQVAIVSPDEGATDALIQTIRVEVCAELCDANGNRGPSFFLEVSPAELRHLLKAPSLPLRDPVWWLDAARNEDLWPFLWEHLAVESNEWAGEDGSPVSGPVGLCYSRVERGPADRVPGALSSLEALACANELLDLVWLQETGSREDTSGGLAIDCETFPPVLDRDVPLPEVRCHDLGEPIFVRSAASAVEMDDIYAHFNRDGGSGGSSSCFAESLPLGAKVSAERCDGGEVAALLEVAEEASVLELDRDGRVQRDVQTGVWESLVNFSGYSLSLEASGGAAVVLQVPGACAHGRRGLWFPDALSGAAGVELTQAAARFFRDAHASSSDSVLVNMTMALDSAMLFAPLIAWEDFSTFPVPTPAEEVQGAIPLWAPPPVSLCSDLLRSPIRDRMSYTVMVLSSLPVEGVDFLPTDTPRKSAGYCRHFPDKNALGFRQRVEVTLLGVDPVLATMVFGVSRMGALPNALGVNTRNIWHNTVAVTEHINRPRSPKDYHYILSCLTSRGANDPVSYTTRMRAAEMVGLTSSAFAAFEEDYHGIQEVRGAFQKQLALDAKIERVQNQLKLREKMQSSKVRDELQRAYEKKLRKVRNPLCLCHSADKVKYLLPDPYICDQATKSESGWRGRYRMSSLVELQGNWERRRDDRTGLYFFHRIAAPRELMLHASGPGRHPEGEMGERYADTCQWEVPPQWDGDPLSSASAIGTVGDDPANYGPLCNGNGQTRFREGGSLSGEASLCSDLRTADDLDQYDVLQATAQKRVAAGVPHYVIRPGNSADYNGADPATKGAFDQPPDSWLPGSASRQGRPPNRPQNPAASFRRPKSGRSEHSGLNSVAADRSLAESVAPTIDTVNLEHIAEQLVSSDELMRVLARRLGLPESQVVSADDLSSVFSISSGKAYPVDFGQRSGSYSAPTAPRDGWADELREAEMDSEGDLWSDDEEVAGDFDEERELGAPEDMPGSQLEAAQLKRRLWREQNYRENLTAPVQVPYLHLPRTHVPSTRHPPGEGEDTREEVFGWRRLPRPEIKPGFLSNSLMTHTRGPDRTSSNTLNAPVFLMPISPVDACKYVPAEFAATVESIFVPDAKRDMERSVATVERNIKREEELSRNLPTDDLLLFGEAREFTSVDAYLARQAREDQAAVADPREEAREKAILAAKSTNVAQMEDALAEDIPVNTADEFGNTLLILAAQQGSKRMCKFLLRRGADINMQSLAGNTPLHYCYAYSQHALAEYLKSKGADDSIVNADGLTCYEGLSRSAMNEEYGDGEEEMEEEKEEDDSGGCESTTFNTNSHY